MENIYPRKILMSPRIFKMAFTNNSRPYFERIFNEDGKINMVVNTMVDYMSGDIDEEQLRVSLYQANMECFENQRKFSDIMLDDRIFYTTTERIEKTIVLVKEILTKIKDEHPEMFKK